MTRYRRLLMPISLGALILGAVIGLLIHSSGATFESLTTTFEVVSRMWMRALQMAVLPLLASYLVLAVASKRELGSVAGIGGYSILVHVAILLSVAGMTLLVAPILVGSFDVSALGRYGPSAAMPDLPSAPTQTPDLANRITHLIPKNPFRAAADGDMLPLVVAIILFSLAAAQIKEELRKIIISLFRAIAETAQVLVNWILLFLPLAVMGFALTITADSGLSMVGPIGFFIGVSVGLLVVGILLLYTLSVTFGAVSLPIFVKAMIPATMLAVASRSSLACLPTLTRGARDTLKLPDEVVGITLPLGVSVFKFNMGITGMFKVVFLTHLVGVGLSPTVLAIFVVTTLILSFGTPGIPSIGASMPLLPVYVAAGVPAEVYVFFLVLDDIPDVFKTVANVTEDMTVAVLVSRLVGRSGKDVLTPSTVHLE